MTEAQALYESIADQLVSSHLDITHGKMMTAPGLKYRNKVFAFFYEGEMTFKLGKGFEPGDYGLHEVRFLSPFKNKPPMKAWIIVSDLDHDKWAELAELALEKIGG